MPSSARQPLALREDLASNQLRNRLAGLAINPRTKLHADRVSKSTSSKPTGPPSRRRPRAPPPPRITRSLNLTPTEAECAQAVFERLQLSSRWAGRAPQLCQSSNGSYELEYRPYRRWALRELRRTLTAEDLSCIWKVLVGDIQRLYEAHVAYIPTAETLTLVRTASGTTYRPVVDKFDFSKHVDDPAVPWTDLMKHRISIVSGQLEVLVRLAEFRDSSLPLPMEVAGQPDTVIEVLKSFPPSFAQRNAILRQLTPYSHKLGQHIAYEVGRQLVTYDTRTGPPDECARILASDAHSTLLHALKMRGEYMKDKQVELEDLDDRVSLCIMLVAILIHLHAKEIHDSSGIGLVRSHRGALADSYTSLEGFQSVANAYCEMNEAICQFEDGGGIISNNGLWSHVIGLFYGSRNCDQT